MAIIVEEQRSGAGGGGGSIVSFVIWLSVLGAIAAAVYYLFFAEPERFVGELISPGFAPTAEIASLKMDPDAAVASINAARFEPFVTLTETGVFGTKLNPFVPLSIPGAAAAPAAPATRR